MPSWRLLLIDTFGALDMKDHSPEVAASSLSLDVCHGEQMV